MTMMCEKMSATDTVPDTLENRVIAWTIERNGYFMLCDLVWDLELHRHAALSVVNRLCEYGYLRRVGKTPLYGAIIYSVT